MTPALTFRSVTLPLRSLLHAAMARRSGDRRKRRKEAEFACLFDLSEALGKRVIGTVDIREADARVKLGTARRVYMVLKDGEDARWVGYQYCDAPKTSDSRPSSLFLTARDAELIAGQAFVGGQSHTDLLSEEQKLLRQQDIRRDHGRIVALEDDIELANAKLAGMHPRLSYLDRIVVVPVIRSNPPK